jgi:hypothetical protein
MRTGSVRLPIGRSGSRQTCSFGNVRLGVDAAERSVRLYLVGRALEMPRQIEISENNTHDSTSNLCHCNKVRLDDTSSGQFEHLVVKLVHCRSRIAKIILLTPKHVPPIMPRLPPPSSQQRASIHPSIHPSIQQCNDQAAHRPMDPSIQQSKTSG